MDGDLSTSRVQHIQKSPSVYFIPFSSPRPLFLYDWPTLPMDFSPYSWIIYDRRVCAKIHGWGLSTSRVQQIR